MISTNSDVLAIQTVADRAAATHTRVGMQVCDPFGQRLTRHSNEERRIEPVVSEAVATMDRQRDRVLIDAEPAVERKRNLDHFAAFYRSKVDLLLLRVGAVAAYAMRVG